MTNDNDRAELWEKIAQIVPRDKKMVDHVLEVFDAYASKQAEAARVETMAHVLLSVPGEEFTITRKAIEEFSKNMVVTRQPDSWLSGGLTYKLSRREKTGGDA